VPFFFYVGHLLVAHLIAIAMNLVRYGRASFLLIAPPSMGSPRELFPPGYGWPLWTVYAVWVGVLLLLFPHVYGSHASSSVVIIGGSHISDLLRPLTEREFIFISEIFHVELLG